MGLREDPSRAAGAGPRTVRTAIGLSATTLLVAIVAWLSRTTPPQPAAAEPQPTGGLVRVQVTAGEGPDTPVDSRVAQFDPRLDAWETEVLNELAGAQLKLLKAAIEHPEQRNIGHLAGLLATEFTCDALQPGALEGVFDDGALTVRRWRRPAGPTTVPPHRGTEGLVRALEDLDRALGPLGDTSAQLKLYRITRGEQDFTTSVRFEANRRAPAGVVQHRAEWTGRWAYPEGSAKPRLRALETHEYEQVGLTTDAALFQDVTASVLGELGDQAEQNRRSIDHWLPRISRSLSMSVFGHHGLAVGDVDGDDLEDLYVCDAGGLPNRLYLQQPDGSLRDASSEAGVDVLDHSTAALLVDLDEDGDQDLFVVGFLLLFGENDGTGRFTWRTRIPVATGSTSACAADYDEDGDLDLFVCGYTPDPRVMDLPSPVPYHDAENGGANLLLRNDGDFRFTDVTEEAGLGQNNSRFSFAAAWNDYDDDGDMDLYVANDFGRNNLYRNDGGRFSDVAAEAGVEDIASGMSVAWGDYNLDGHMDVYVGNMFSAAGNRVTFQQEFLEDHSDETAADVQRMARGNTLYANAGDGTFRDVSEEALVAMGRWAWSSRFMDMNNDGLEDLVVANGYITTEDSGDL